MAGSADIFLDEAGIEPEYDTHGWPEEDRHHAYRLTTLEMEKISAALNGRDQAGAEDTFEMVGDPMKQLDSWTAVVPAAFVDAVRDLNDESLHTAAARCAHVTQQELDWPAEEFVSLLVAWKQLAERSASTGKAMYFWMSL